MATCQEVKNLPIDVVLNISSFLLGTPEDLKFKNNKKFVELQRLLKIEYTQNRIRDAKRLACSTYT